MLMLKNQSLIFILFAIFFHTAVDASDLKINSISIYFSNDRPEITVKRNYPLTAYAEIGYTGVEYCKATGKWMESF